MCWKRHVGTVIGKKRRRMVTKKQNKVDNLSSVVSRPAKPSRAAPTPLRSSHHVEEQGMKIFVLASLSIILIMLSSLFLFYSDGPIAGEAVSILNPQSYGGGELLISYQGGAVSDLAVEAGDLVNISIAGVVDPSVDVGYASFVVVLPAELELVELIPTTVWDVELINLTNDSLLDPMYQYVNYSVAIDPFAADPDVASPLANGLVELLNLTVQISGTAVPEDTFPVDLIVGDEQGYFDLLGNNLYYSGVIGADLVLPLIVNNPPSISLDTYYTELVEGVEENVLITATGGDLDGDSLSVFLEVYSGETFVEAIIPGEPSSVGLDFQEASPGVWTLAFVTEDTVPGVSVAAFTVYDGEVYTQENYTLNITENQIFVELNESIGSFTIGDAFVNISLNASSLSGEVLNSQVLLYDNQSEYFMSEAIQNDTEFVLGDFIGVPFYSQNTNNWTFEVDFGSLEHGNYTLLFSVYGQNENEVNVSYALEIIDPFLGNEAPVISSIDDQVVVEDEPLSLTFNIVDEDHASLQYGFDWDGVTSSEGWLTHVVGHKYAFLVDESNYLAGDFIEVAVNVTDHAGEEVSEEFTITVVGEQPLVLGSVEDQVIPTGNSFVLDVSYDYELIDSVDLSFDLDGIPGDSSWFINHFDGTATLTLDESLYDVGDQFEISLNANHPDEDLVSENFTLLVITEKEHAACEDRYDNDLDGLIDVDDSADCDVDMDLVVAPLDCNDGDPTVGSEIVYYFDADGDGYGINDTSSELSSCDLSVPIGYSDNALDCHDADPTKGVVLACYPDLDGDGVGAGELVFDICLERCGDADYSDLGTDCDDTDGSVTDSCTVSILPAPDPTPLTPTRSSGGGGGRGSSNYLPCVEDWSCADWSYCSAELEQIRECVDANACGTENNKPEVTRPCNSCVESWSCGSWAVCSSSGSQSRTCFDLHDCGSVTLKPDTVRSCEYAGAALGTGSSGSAQISGAESTHDSGAVQSGTQVEYVQVESSVFDMAIVQNVQSFMRDNWLPSLLVALGLIVLIALVAVGIHYHRKHAPAENLDELEHYVQAEMAGGMTAEMIEKNLTHSGWNKKEVETVLARMPASGYGAAGSLMK